MYILEDSFPPYFTTSKICFNKGDNMALYKVTATIEVNTEADDEATALEIGTECMDWSNANITVEEMEVTNG